MGICDSHMKLSPASADASEIYFHRPQSWVEKLDWSQVFAGPTERIHIDIGAGDGTFILGLARLQPGTRFLALERLLGRARKISKRAFKQGLSNVRVLRIEAAYAVEHLFPAGSIDAFTVLYPDPWPKRRHHPNRLIQPGFLASCARCMRPGGTLAIKTDNTPYFEHIQKVLTACRELEILKNADPGILTPITTDFEAEFQKENRPVHFIAARKP
jgi:tRNA (guanine-N7-)-methyltransferase